MERDFAKKSGVGVHLFLLLVVVAAGGSYLYSRFFTNVIPSDLPPRTAEEPARHAESEPMPDIAIIVENLTIPWDIAFLPSGEMLVAERPGNLLLFSGGLKKTIPIPGTEHAGEGGLLGIALHPNFAANRYVYLYHTTQSGAGFINRVVRYTFVEDGLREAEVIISNIPGARFHDGGRIAFDSNEYLYITTGDAGNPQSAQDINSLAGKILRIHDDGTIPPDNPFSLTTSQSKSPVWSYGHRNPQGLAWDKEDQLWQTEHGPSGIWPNCCQDEINLIEKSGNYGWPESVGATVRQGTIAPALQSGRDVWAPASALYFDGSIFFGGLRGEILYEAVLRENRVAELREHFLGEFGRIRTVVLGPDGMFYITTSNRDGRGTVRAGDDKIIRINPAIFRR